jgi:hypothetical protein
MIKQQSRWCFEVNIFFFLFSFLSFFLYTLQFCLLFLQVCLLSVDIMQHPLWIKKMRLCSKKVKVCSRDNIDYHSQFELTFHSLLFFCFNIYSTKEQEYVISLVYFFFVNKRRISIFKLFFSNLFLYFLIDIKPKKMTERERERIQGNCTHSMSNIKSRNIKSTHAIWAFIRTRREKKNIERIIIIFAFSLFPRIYYVWSRWREKKSDQKLYILFNYRFRSFVHLNRSMIKSMRWKIIGK